jgi:threonine dehydratase
MLLNEKIIKDLSIMDIWEAKKRIDGFINRTPLIYSKGISELSNTPCYLKLENLQDINAFKIRGAANKILSLSEEERRLGVTTFSTGNHGLAVATISNKLGIESTICMSENVPQVKVQAIQSLGTKIKLVGSNQDDAQDYCFKLQREKGMTVINPFDDPYVIAGQGTIALELLEDMPDLNNVIVPVSGGGIMSGIAFFLKTINPNIKVIGVSQDRAPVMVKSIEAGHPIRLEEKETLADSLLGGIGDDNQYTFKMVQKYVDEIQLISEDEIAEAMVLMLKTHRMLIEGASATGIAEVVKNKDTNRYNGKTAIIITGSNVGYDSLVDILKKRKEL